MARYYVSVTGLQLKSIWYAPKFWRRTIPAFAQAEQAEGNVYCQTKSRDGVHHTLTVWDSRESMRKFMFSGAHAQAMKILKEVANLETTKVYGYESDEIPTWEQALQEWDAHGKLYGRAMKTDKKERVDAPVQGRNTALRIIVLSILGAFFLSRLDLFRQYFS